MKNFYPTPIAGAFSAGISLQSLISRLVYLSQHCESADSIYNHIPEELTVVADEAKLSPVIRELLTTILMNARNGDIHISAEEFDNIVRLQIQDRNSYNGYAVASRLQCIAADAFRIGGHIDHKGHNQLVSTVSLSFPRRPISA